MMRYGILATALLAATVAHAADEPWTVHGQFTLVDQFHPRFTAPYTGRNSLNPGNRGNETTDATLFFGLRLWDGASFTGIRNSIRASE